MPEDKPFPPERDPEMDKNTVPGEPQDDASASAEGAPSALDDALSESQFNPVVADAHDLPTLEMDEDDDETDDLQPVKAAPPPTPRSDPRKTLPGSGGYDPNPDFLSEGASGDTPFDGGQTLPHFVPFEHTLVHVPGEENRPRPSKPVPQPSALSPQQQTTIPAPPYQQTTQPAQQPTYPVPQGQFPSAQVPNRQNAALPPRSKPRPRRILGCSPGCAAIFVGLFVTFCGGLTLITLLLSATLGTRLEEQLQAQVAQVDDYSSFQSTFWYDRTGRLLYESFNEGRRTNVNYDQFPQSLINATIAIEDSSFFTNPGFEIQATARAFLQYVGLAQGDTGGSTITQQVVRNVLFDYEYRTERSVQRKVEEILLAFLLRQRQSPEKVLELYLNEIYYGNLSYGAEAAAQTFFGKSVSELTLGESALLAALPQAPANLEPLNQDPAVQQAVEARWRLVLDRMVQEHFITSAQRDEALRQGLTYNPPDAPLRAPHFTVYAQQELQALLTELQLPTQQIASGGFRIYTTVDLDINDMAQQAARSQISALAANNATNAAVLVLQPLTGEVLAMVGSIDYNNDAIDGRVNVATSLRQPGSTMKPLTYSSAMEHGMTPGDIIWDTEIHIDDYTPVNYDRSWHGPVRMRTALANSYNIPAVQTLRSVGVASLMEIAQRFGVESLGTDPSQYGLSLTLGGGDITLLELTRAYSTFANGGSLVPTTSILCVLDGDDNIIYQYESGCPHGNTTPSTVNREGYGRQVVDPRIAYIIGDILSDNAARTPAMGSNSPLNTGSLATSVKTGTTDNFKDNWTVGYTRNVAVGVWVGNSNGDPMTGNTSGLTGAAPIWNSVINAIYNNNNMLGRFAVDGSLLPDQLNPPSGMSLRGICDISSLREPATDCAGTVNEWFLDGPAGIPDADGNLQFPQQAQPTQEQPPAAGPWLQEFQPDIFSVLVNPIDPNIANSIQFAVQPGQPQPPPPLYCQVPIEIATSAPAARQQLFIAPPPVPADAAYAEQYARANGFAFLPTIACTPELLSASGSPVVITAFISQPTAGQIVSPGFPIAGTVQFSPSQALYWKLELYGGQFGNQWVTMNDVRYDSIVNGQLETIPNLQPGDYQMQLIVVGNDGNYVQAPYQVPFTVQ
ncbi:MAG: transglycosylase domain-containing protein [Chloroflexota bacterium]